MNTITKLLNENEELLLEVATIRKSLLNSEARVNECLNLLLDVEAPDFVDKCKAWVSTSTKLTALEAFADEIRKEQTAELATVTKELERWQRPFDKERFDTIKEQASHIDSLAACSVYITALEHALKHSNAEALTKIARLGTVPMKYRRMKHNAKLQNEVEELTRIIAEERKKAESESVEKFRRAVIAICNKEMDEPNEGMSNFADGYDAACKEIARLVAAAPQPGGK